MPAGIEPATSELGCTPKRQFVVYGGDEFFGRRFLSELPVFLADTERGLNPRPRRSRDALYLCTPNWQSPSSGIVCKND